MEKLKVELWVYVTDKMKVVLKVAKLVVQLGVVQVDQ